MSDTYPSSVSRTLSPGQRAFRTVVALHDKKLADADYNLTQDVQDLKLESLVRNAVCSGALSYIPFQFTSNTAGTFSIPKFDALVHGRVITVAGNASSNLSSNLVTLPPPVYWTAGSSNPEVSLYSVFLEVWDARVDPASGTGFFLDPITGTRYIYPDGCVNATRTNMLPDDTIDPFMGVETTERVQVQWAIRVQPLATSYDFSKYAFGLDPGATSSETVWGQGPQSSPQATAPYQFTNMVGITGDAGVWRSGDGNVNNNLATLDGYTYAIPIAIVMQRNKGAYSIAANPAGCANPTVPSSGLLVSGVSGRYDGKFADVIYASDVVDTRSTISQTGEDLEKLMREGFVDLISGSTRSALARGQLPGGLTQYIGATLNYQISVGPSTVANTDGVGQFDGFMNGFRTDGGTFTSTQVVTVNDKTTGVIGGRWTQNDVVSFSLPGDSKAVISTMQIQGLVSNSATSTKAPASLLAGQIQLVGLGTNTVTITFSKDLTGTAFDPGTNPLYLTIGVTYPVNSGMDLRHIPDNVSGGLLTDATSGKTLPVFGVSYYDVQAQQPVTSATGLWAINPQYSNVIFGTRVWIAVAGSSGTTSTDGSGNVTTTFTLPRGSLNGSLTGLYVTRAWDQTSGNFYGISGRSIHGTNLLLSISGNVSSSSTMIVSFICADTAQLSYNAAVKGVAAIEETVLCGTVTTDTNFHMDDRLAVVSVQNISGVSNTVVIAVSNATLNGIAGDDVVKFIWVQDSSGFYDAVQIGSAQFANGMVTLVVPPSVNLTTQAFFVVAAILPAFDPASTLLLAESYVPYQGEGTLNRDYEVVYAEDSALVTTNGTGAAPLPGLSDVYPYNREFPISAALPSRAEWTDSSLANTAIATMVSSNYEAKSFDSVSHTFEVPLYSNDFIQPLNMDRRKAIQFIDASGNRGFSTATPHVGFAIPAITARTANVGNLAATTASITLYVDNVNGNDSNSGLSAKDALNTIQAAVDALPPVLRHSCTIIIIPNSSPISILANPTSLVTIPLGDGVVRSANYYALANLAFSVQESGCLTITSASTITNAVIDCTGFGGFGDGPTSAFFVNNTRAIFRGITFKGFTDAAVKGIAADLEFISCTFATNLVGASFEESSTVILDSCTVNLGDGGTGIIASQSAVDITSTSMGVSSGTTPNTFWVMERGSTLALDLHTSSQETNITGATLIAQAELNSSIVCTSAYSSQGAAVVQMNSVLSRTVSVNPFLGGVTTDASSNVSTEL